MEHLKPTPERATTSSTPGHTIGPFFHDALAWASVGGVDDDPRHGSIRIEGSVEDGSGERLPAWLVEAWVPGGVDGEREAGLPAPGFRRLMNDSSGAFTLRVPAPPAREPAAYVTLFGLGLTRHFCTVVYLDAGAGEPVAGAMLDAVPVERRATLVAKRIAANRYQWVIRTQGADETVFFDYR
jgi:protocatechuate 3,4-dioxygenase, alpha subunit